MWYFDESTLLLTHWKLIERFGGSHGVRDIDRVRSVLTAPQQEVFGAEQYHTPYEKAAVYARNIIGDHPFVDGNKRTGITCAVMFLRKNKVVLKFNIGELEDFAVTIATDRLDIAEIAAWLEAHTT